jgi:predicted acylesterase/phospholipase RssA
MLKVIGCLLVFLSALQGCTGVAAVNGSQSAPRGMPLDASISVRTLGLDHQFSQQPVAVLAERLREKHLEEPLYILALSSGANSAFGAGAIAGLSSSGSRPEFAVVTGVSGGALVAPYAFLGATWDASLRDVFTDRSAQRLLQSRGLAALFSSSVYRGAPLRQLVEAHVTNAMIKAVAHEADKGRLLLVATTDVATGESVVWDMSAIARNGGPDARALFCDVLVASASIPGIFPPVEIRVHEQGTLRDEAHIDGAATMPFFVPAAFLRSQSEASGGTPRVAVYLVINGALTEAARTTRLTAGAILTRSIESELSHMMLATLELTAVTAQLQRAALVYTAIPSGYPGAEAFDFRMQTRRALFGYAYGCAQTGQLWLRFGQAQDHVTSLLDRTDYAREPPCPANDPFMGFLVSR